MLQKDFTKRNTSKAKIFLSKLVTIFENWPTNLSVTTYQTRIWDLLSICSTSIKNNVNYIDMIIKVPVSKSEKAQSKSYRNVSAN